MVVATESDTVAEHLVVDRGKFKRLVLEIRPDELHYVKSSVTRRQDKVAAKLEPFRIGLDNLIL